MFKKKVLKAEPKKKVVKKREPKECPKCGGSGLIDAATVCDNCGGSGQV